MPDFFRTRDCVFFSKDESLPVVVSSAMVQGGWPGGQGVQWVGSVEDEFLVTYARGQAAGFLIWGSDEDGDKHTAITGHQPHYRFATMISGSVIFATSSYERYTLASRLAPPLVPIVYAPNQPLFFSLRGLWTNEDELTLSGDATAPAGLAGMVAQVPKALNHSFLGVQTLL